MEDVTRALATRGEVGLYGADAPGVQRLTFSALWSRLRREPMVVHAHRNNELLLALGLRLFAPQLKVVFTRHSATAPGAWSRWLMRRADRVVAMTDEVAAGLGAAVVPHGVDLTRFRPPADRAAAWASLGLGGERGLGVIGRIRPDKGQGDFVEAVTPVPAGWRAAVIGLAKDPAFLASLTARGVAHVEQTSDIERWYRGLSIVVQPSHHEGFGLVMLEAMASGCCVVATALPHVPRFIEHGRTGVLFPPGDVLALREALEPLLREPARAEAIGAAAAEEARARFGLEHEAEALSRLYAQVLTTG